jgi:hypothetical protein
MRNALILIALATTLAGAIIFAGPASAGRPGTGTVREAELTGAKVLPPPGDPNGSGIARMIFNPKRTRSATGSRYPV